MSFSRQDIVNDLNENIDKFKGIQKVYQEKFVNYRGKSKDDKEYYTEVIAEELINIGFFDSIKSIEEIVRDSGYRVNGHDGVSNPDKIIRQEEIFCKKLYCLSNNEEKIFEGIGKILDYQVPLKSSHSDTGVGKIDLIASSPNVMGLKNMT